jgi:mRNA deadenylase 3'-5' endonuclease subunit Ccr4
LHNENGDDQEKNDIPVVDTQPCFAFKGPCNSLFKGSGLTLLTEQFIAKHNAFIANIDAWPSNQFIHFLFGLTAK